MIYALIFVLLFVLETCYLRIARTLGIVDTPTWRSSHTSVTVCGGGIIFVASVWLFWILFGFKYTLFLIGLTLVGAISFMDDIRSLPIWPRLLVQVVAVTLLMVQLGVTGHPIWWIIAAVIIGTGMTNMFNFMDGINGITVLYSLSVLSPLLFLNLTGHARFIDMPLLYCVALGLVVLMFFNFRSRALCFPGDVGGISAGFILFFILSKLIVATGNYAYLVFIMVYAADVIPTMVHLLLIGENPIRAHRRYCYQIMANELNIPHLAVAATYAIIQLVLSAGLIFLPIDGYIYMACAAVILTAANVCFRRRYYHLHSAYLQAHRSSLSGTQRERAQC